MLRPPKCAAHRHAGTAIATAVLPGTAAAALRGRQRPALAPPKASSRPPGPEYAALEAAVGAINKVLALNNKIKGGKPGQVADPREAARADRAAAAAAVRADPGKLVTFRARASGAKDVTEEFPIQTSSDAAAAAAAAAAATTPRRDLRSYLSLPLEEYSLLDPRYIARMEEDGSTSTNGTGRSSHAETNGSGSGSSSGEAAAAEAVGSGAQRPASGAFLLTVPLVDIVGLDLTPQLVVRVDVDEARGQVTFTAGELATGVPQVDADAELHLRARMGSNIKRKAHVVTPAAAATAAAAPAGGAAKQQQHSQHHHQGHKHKHPHARDHGGSNAHQHQQQHHHHQQNASSAVAAPAGEGPATSAAEPAAAGTEAALAQTPSASSGGAPVSVAAATPAAAAEGVEAAAAGAEAAGPLPRLQQVSRLKCEVEVRIRVRVPPPLSAVPGPLLSTTAGLLAKLVMQALLPSFLDLLAVDYARWAAGDATRRSAAAGSLLPDKPAATPPAAAPVGREG